MPFANNVYKYESESLGWVLEIQNLCAYTKLFILVIHKSANLF